ncbi:MAG: DEAD/DEAH box helicase [Chloroflexi bacterium]|nr:DEAD/DEAH box helicase [Chloroflexota bacterium]
MHPREFLGKLRKDGGFRGQIVHLEHLAAHPARFGTLDEPLAPTLAQSLARLGVRQLYTHQAQAIHAARAGQHFIVATSTSSGKTLCYNLPVLEALLSSLQSGPARRKSRLPGQKSRAATRPGASQPQARALYLFPTKALAQDQLRSLTELTSGLAGGSEGVNFGTYDGDTPREARAQLRHQAHILLTNPDMLHAGILPNHTLWSDFLGGLRYVVIDEAHAYRGIFGSHVACILRRLRRLCAFYGSQPQFICSTATIANPAEHMQHLTGLGSPVVIDEDGSPTGSREFVLWNPPFIDKAQEARRSTISEAASLLAALTMAGMRTLVFGKSRKVAELVLIYAREALKKAGAGQELGARLRAYRAGYTPEERRTIERDLFAGRLLGVTATNALELGVDIGALDATVLVGFPGTVASMWQQAGRSGRGSRDALTVLIGLDNPLDQYYMQHPRELLSRSHERALIDEDNIYILQDHLPCAAYEYPLSHDAAFNMQDDTALFGPGFEAAMIHLEEAELMAYRDGRWYWQGQDYPAQKVNIRSESGEAYALLDIGQGNRLLEEIDASTAAFRIHPGAVYLHQGESYLVQSLDTRRRVALAQLTEGNWYTQPTEVNNVRIVGESVAKPAGATTVHLGHVRVFSQVVGYRRLQQFTEEVLSTESLAMPPTTYDTVAIWWDISADVVQQMRDTELDPAGGLHAAEHAAIGLLPLFAMCDRWDIGGLSTLVHPDSGLAQVFIYDGHPGGIGLAECGYQQIETLWSATLDHVRNCPCAAGCPSCIQSPKCGNNNMTLDKASAIFLLQHLLKSTR